MVITIFLLLFLFLVGFLNLFFYLPSKKIYAWLESFFFENKNVCSVPKGVITTQVLDKQKGSLENLDSKKKNELKRVFATFDKNGDGFITKQELKDSLKNIRILVTNKEVEEMVLKVDSNGDGLIDFDEFCFLCESLAMSSKGGSSSSGDERKSEENEQQEEDELREAFEVFDKDKDGLISAEELGFVLCSLGLKEGKRVEDCKEMIKKVDMNSDGMVNFDEFKQMMRSGSSNQTPIF